jgi:hypothetical protein
MKFAIFPAILALVSCLPSDNPIEEANADKNRRPTNQPAID